MSIPTVRSISITAAPRWGRGCSPKSRRWSPRNSACRSISCGSPRPTPPRCRTPRRPRPRRAPTSTAWRRRSPRGEIKRAHGRFRRARRGGWRRTRSCSATGLVFGGNKSMSFGELAKACRINRVAALGRGLLQDPGDFLGPRRRQGQAVLLFRLRRLLRGSRDRHADRRDEGARVDILHDVGSSLNPALDLGQVEGAFVQGMGWLTTEELVFDAKGRLTPTRRRPTRSRSPPTFPSASSRACTCGPTRPTASTAPRRSASRR